MCSYEKEMSKLWNYVADNNKKTDERINKVEEKIESVNFAVGVSNTIPKFRHFFLI